MVKSLLVPYKLDYCESYASILYSKVLLSFYENVIFTKLVDARVSLILFNKIIGQFSF